MSDRTIVQEFLYHLDADDVPIEYISAASILDQDGAEITLRGDELKRLLDNAPEYHHVNDARIYINLHKVVKAVTLEVEYVLDNVQKMFLNDLVKKDDDNIA